MAVWPILLPHVPEGGPITVGKKASRLAGGWSPSCRVPPSWQLRLALRIARGPLEGALLAAPVALKNAKLYATTPACRPRRPPIHPSTHLPTHQPTHPVRPSVALHSIHLHSIAVYCTVLHPVQCISGTVRAVAPWPSGNRLIFLNVPLLDFEQKALQSLHDALKDEKAGSRGIRRATSGVAMGAVRLWLIMAFLTCSATACASAPNVDAAGTRSGG